MKHWKIATIAALAFSSANLTAAELRVYNWAEYMGEKTLADFTKETGIKVIYDTYTSIEEMETKLLIGSSGFDIVFAAGPPVERFIGVGLLKKIDKKALANINNLDALTLKTLTKQDPGNLYAIPYTWGTVGIGYNSAKIKERMQDAPVDSLDIIFKPEIAKKFADCGIAVLDSPGEIINMVLSYLGLDPHSSKKSDIKKAQKLISAIRPHIRYFNSTKPIDDLATGEICLALMYNGDVGIAADAASKAKNGVEPLYSIPKEGTLIWIDSMIIPADAKNIDSAHKFIDYMMRPEVIADVSNTIFYANANSASKKLVNSEITSDPNIYPSTGVVEKLFGDIAMPKKSLRLRTRAWTKIKTGH